MHRTSLPTYIFFVFVLFPLDSGKARDNYVCSTGWQKEEITCRRGIKMNIKIELRDISLLAAILLHEEARK